MLAMGVPNIVYQLCVQVQKLIYIAYLQPRI